MKRIFYLSTCDTCKRILSSWNTDGIELQDIKTADDRRAGRSYDWLGRICRGPVLETCTQIQGIGVEGSKFIRCSNSSIHHRRVHLPKRPVLVLDEQIFVGNSKKVVEAAAEALR